MSDVGRYQEQVALLGRWLQDLIDEKGFGDTVGFALAVFSRDGADDGEAFVSNVDLAVAAQVLARVRARLLEGLAVAD